MPRSIFFSHLTRKRFCACMRANLYVRRSIERGGSGGSTEFRCRCGGGEGNLRNELERERGKR